MSRWLQTFYGKYVACSRLSQPLYLSAASELSFVRTHHSSPQRLLFVLRLFGDCNLTRDQSGMFDYIVYRLLCPLEKKKQKTETIGEQGLNCPLSGMGAGWRHYWNLSLSRGQEWLVGVDKIIDNGFAKQHGEIIVCLLLQTMRGLGIGRVEWEWAGP